MGRGHLSLGTMILTVEAGRGVEGSFVCRNNDSNCKAGRGGEGSFVSRKIFLTVEPGRG